MFKIMLKARQERVRLVIGQNLKTLTWGWKYGISTRTSPETEPRGCLLLDGLVGAHCEMREEAILDQGGRRNLSMY